MNSYRQVLVHMNDGALSREVLAYGAAVAAAQGCGATALLALPPLAPGAFLSAETASVALRAMTDQQRLQREAAQAAVAAVAGESGVAIELLQGEGEPVDALAAAGRACDVLVVGQQAPGGTGGLESAATARLLMSAGCPLLIVPHIGRPAGGQGVAQRILVAWAGTRESARALRDALPLLQRAQRVELVSFVHGDEASGDPAPPGADEVIAYLARHGVAAQAVLRRSREPSLGERMRRAWVPDASVAEALLSHAADGDADLVVMGGYGHARAWEFVLGGVTRTLLQSMTVPVFMSH